MASDAEHVFLRAPDDSRYLDQVLFPKYLALGLLDEVFVPARVPDGLTLTFYNFDDANLGDVAFAWKAAALMEEHIPNLDVALVTTNPEKAARFDWGRARLIPEADFASLAPERFRHPSLCLSAPGIFDRCRFGSEVYRALGMNPAVPFLYVGEYGYIRLLRADQEKPIRPEADRLVDETLDSLAARRENGEDADIGYHARSGDVLVTRPDGERACVGNLAEALARAGPDDPFGRWLHNPRMERYPCGLETGEMGIFIDDELREWASSAAAGPHTARDLVAELGEPELRFLLLSAPGALYYGYGHSNIDRFLDIVGLCERRHARDVDIVMPHPMAPADALARYAGEDVRARLGACGVGRLEVHGNGAAATADIGPGKRLRLLVHHPLRNVSVRLLLRASEPPTMVSGDQSTSEALSAGKWIVVNEPIYCQTYVIDAILGLASAQWQGLRDILDFGVAWGHEPARYRKAADALESASLAAHYRALRDRIWKEHRLNERLMGLVKRTLLEELRADVVEQERAILQYAYGHFTRERGLAVRKADLLRLAQTVGSET